MVKTNQLILIGIVALVLAFSQGWLNFAGTGSAFDSGGVADDGVLITGDQSTAQTISAAAYNYDKPNTAVAITDGIVYLSDKKTKNPGNTSTTPGEDYYVYGTASGYCADVVKVDASYLAAPKARLEVRDFDTAITETFVNNDGRTSNTNTANLTVGSGASTTAFLEIVPSALYKRLSCEDGRVAYWINATNRTDWDSAQFSMRAPNGQACSPIGIVPNAISEGQVLKGFACNADFTGSDTSIYKFELTIKAQSGTNPDSQALTVSYAPYDVYENTITGALETNPIKDDGSAIQTLQTATLYVG